MVNEDFSFGQILDIFLSEQLPYFYVQVFQSITFSAHYNCYLISPTDRYILVSKASLLSYLCLHSNYLHTYPDNLAIVIK